jgi:hypothetical protein
MNREEGRKVRSDKKRDVKPTVPIELHDCISRISYITNTPMKDVAERICMAGIQSKEVIEALSIYFKRDFWATPYLLYRGNPMINHDRTRKIPGLKKRITIRFNQDMHDRLTDLSYALDTTVSSATGLLLEYSVKHSNIVHHYMESYVQGILDKNRLSQLKKVIAFINKNNPYNEEITIGMLINYLVDEFKDAAKNIKYSLMEWIDQFTPTEDKNDGNQ